jgi:hypothetical protein
MLIVSFFLTDFLLVRLLASTGSFRFLFQTGRAKSLAMERFFVPTVGTDTVLTAELTGFTGVLAVVLLTAHL